MTVKRRRSSRNEARIQRSLSIIPSLFTIGNVFCGYYSIVSTLRGDWDRAAILIGVGYLLDGLDGRIARLTKTVSDFGIQLDSIADIVTFGVAPAMLAFSWGLGASEGLDGTVAKHVHQFGSLATFAFLVCGALRLARFNTQAKKPTEVGSKRYFVGLPIPSAAGMVAAIVHYRKIPITSIGSSLLWSFLILLLAFLMISTVRYYSFKEFDVKKARPRRALALTAMIIGLIIFYSEEMLLLMATVYAGSGLVLNLVHTVRKLLPGRVSESEPAHGNIKT